MFAFFAVVLVSISSRIVSLFLFGEPFQLYDESRVNVTTRLQQQHQQRQKKPEPDTELNMDYPELPKLFAVTYQRDDTYFRDPNATVVDWEYFPKSLREPSRDASWTEAVTSSSLPMGAARCESVLATIETSPPPVRKPSGRACEGFDGILHINRFDRGGATGTAFFLFAVAMLAWADQHNYLPWIHIDSDFTKPIWDPIVHTQGGDVRFEAMAGAEISWARDPRDTGWNIFPGKPLAGEEQPLRPETFLKTGTGVWEHYFLPPNDFVPGDASCKDKPLVRFDEDHVVPGLHSNAPWAPRAGRYSESAIVLRQDLSLDRFFAPQRKRGAQVTKRHIRFNSVMERRADCVFPNPEYSLGMHIRHGDKMLEREIIEVNRFLPFAEAFVANDGGKIYLATDSSEVVKTILEDWPSHVADRVVRQPAMEGLTSNTTAAFDLGISPHRTNVEALTDILALSRCTFLLHGLSAFSEAVFFLNPGLMERSINLDDPLYVKYKPEYFVKMVMPLGKKKP